MYVQQPTFTHLWAWGLTYTCTIKNCTSLSKWQGRVYLGLLRSHAGQQQAEGQLEPRHAPWVLHGKQCTASGQCNVPGVPSEQEREAARLQRCVPSGSSDLSGRIHLAHTRQLNMQSHVTYIKQCPITQGFTNIESVKVFKIIHSRSSIRCKKPHFALLCISSSHLNQD